jgi:hypothetical protein
VLVACGHPATPAQQCALNADASSRPIERPNALISLRLDDGAPGYETEFLAQIFPDGEVATLSLHMSEPGPNGLVDRHWISSCKSGRLSTDQIRGLTKTLIENHACEQKVQHPMNDVSPYQLMVNLPDARCTAWLDHLETEMTPDGQAIYRAINRTLP